MSTLVGVTVATQSVANAATFGPDGFMDISGAIRYDGTGNAGWANGPEAAADLLPTGTSGADLTTCTGGGIHAPGTKGVFDCGSATSNPTPTNPGFGVFSTAFTSGFSASCGGSYGFATSAQVTDDLTADQYKIANGTPKDNIANTYAIARQGSQGNEVYVGLERPNPGGDTHVDFEFLQENVSLSSASPCGTAHFTSTSPSTGAREQGDVMLEMNYLNGGFSPTPTVYIWSCTGSLVAPPALPLNGTPCSFGGTTYPAANWVVDPACPLPTQTGPGCYKQGAAAIATDQTGTPGYNATAQTISCGGWLCDPPTGSTSVPEFGFTEGAINLDQLGLGVGCESTMMAVTRSSGAGQPSTLKYFSQPTPLDTCTPTQTVTTPKNSSNATISTTTGITLGGTAHDVAVVSPTGGGVPTANPPTGSVAFYVCGPLTTAAGCTSTDTTRQSVATAAPTTGQQGTPTANQTTFTSAGFTPTSPGIYCFEADFTPTGKFESSSDTSSSECFVVNPIAPDFQTSPTTNPITFGGTNTDTATVFGTPAGGAPGGTVQFTLCKESVANTPCTGGTAVGTGAVTLTPVPNTNNASATSASVQPSSPGTWCFNAGYTATSGGNYSSVTTESNPAGECFTVNQQGSQTTTKVTSATVVFGAGGITDTVSVSPSSGSGPAPTGTVQFYVCQTSSTYCPLSSPTDGNAVGLTVPVSGSTSTATSPSFVPTSAGTWCFAAVYSGDGNYLASLDNTNADNADSNECVVVTAAPTATTTTVIDNGTSLAWDNTETTGAMAYDTATVAPNPAFTNAPTPTGTISYTFFPNGSCTRGTGSAAGSNLALGSPSTTEGPLGAGSYSFQATYSGDSNYLTSTGACEPFTVAKGTSTTATTVFDAGTNSAWTGSELGSPSAYDTSTVTPSSDSFLPTGTISYVFFSNGACTGTGTSATPTLNSLSNAGDVPNSITEGPLAQGSYSFQATYSGDTNFAGSIGPCEQFTLAYPVINVVKSEPTPGDGVNVVAGVDTITYNLAVTNTGLAAATDLTVTDAIPAGSTYVPGSANLGGVFDSTTKTISWVLASVPAAVDGTAGTAGPLSFQVTVNAADADGSTITNQAAFSDINTVECTTGPVEGTCLTNQVSNPVVKPIINVVKSEPTPGNGQTVTAGQSAPITYSLSVTNAGSSAATNLTVTDVIPAGSTYVSGSANAGGTYDSTTNTITWIVASVPGAVNGTPGTAGPLTFQVTVNSTDANGSTITNQAAFPDINTVSCTAGTVKGTCLTNQVSNPVVAIVPTPNTAPLVTTTTTLKQVLAFTGADVRALIIIAAFMLGSGLLVLVLGRRRRRQNG